MPSEETYSLDQYAEMMKKNKPYLIALEELVSETEYGQIEIIIDVRAAVAEKMTVVSRKTWLRPKTGHNRAGFSIEKEEKIKASLKM